jgi:hypothetical protein
LATSGEIYGRLASEVIPVGNVLRVVPLPLLLPLVILWLVLLIVALRDLIPRPADQVIGGNKILWGAVVILISTFGPLAYLAFGRRKE